MDEKNTNNDKKRGINDPELIKALERKSYCPHCKQEIESKGDVCPHCRKYLGEGTVAYQPMQKKTVQTIRWILALVLIVVFIIMAAVGVFELRACKDDSGEESRLVNCFAIEYGEYEECQFYSLSGGDSSLRSE